jgi:hypothetical protein
VRIGDIDIAPVVDGTILSRLPATKAFPTPSSDLWRDQHGMFGHDGVIESTLGAFLVRVADRTVLVDVGAGPAASAGRVTVELDGIHCPLELMDDDFNLLVDHDQELANRVREAYARELEGTDVLAAAAHFPGLQFGRLLRGAATRRWTFVGA